jgi:hypothetical protein
MGHLLEPLLHDLADRLLFLGEEIAKLILPPETEPYRRKICERIQHGRARIAEILRDPDSARPEFAKNFYLVYKRLSEFVQQVEEGPFFVLSRFRDEDRFLSRVVGTACKEFSFPHEAPVCAGMSSLYYCASLRMDLILVPQTEASYLLGWADLYHELAHFLLARNEAGLLRPLRKRVRDYFRRAIDDAKRSGWPKRAVGELEQWRELWLGDWILEFACDYFAAFAAGPSFGWSNLRLCARTGSDVFAAESRHPADAARTQATLAMVKQVSLPAEADLIQDKWHELLSTMDAEEPQTFRTAYPEDLIRDLASDAIFCFEASGLRRYKEGSAPLADLLNEAWKKFQEDPKGFRVWELERLRRLRANFELV